MVAYVAELPALYQGETFEKCPILFQFKAGENFQ
jgi:hypothetical protein